MSNYNRHKAMIAKVATAMGPELLDKVAFVGGCTTGLLLTDDFSREQVRHTDDVDLIVHVVGHIGWARLQEHLRSLGFRDDPSDGGPICAMKLGELRVDFMPDDARVLSFTNRWYADALASAEPVEVERGITIRLVQPAYFIATKLEAYQQRGNDDPLGSHDMEDILALIDGRVSLVQELESADPELRRYVGEQFRTLQAHPQFDYAVQSAACGSVEREDVIWERIDRITQVRG